MDDMKQLLLGAALLMFSMGSQATIYQYSDPNASTLNERLNSISTTYDDINQVFTWSVTLNDGRPEIDSFWLVVNDGPMPHHQRKETAIMYGDLENNILTTYVYDPVKGFNSWEKRRLYLQTDEITTEGNTISFAIDTTEINNWKPHKKHYDGITFDEKIGIWFFTNAQSGFEYNRKDKIKHFVFDNTHRTGRYDIINEHATVIPIPAAAWLFAPAIMLLGGLRKRK